jgi:hypothetical protein
MGENVYMSFLSIAKDSLAFTTQVQFQNYDDDFSNMGQELISKQIYSRATTHELCDFGQVMLSFC